MTDLATFLRARYAEHRELALAASPGPWHVNPEDEDEVLAVDDIVVCEAFALSGRQLRATASFIAVNDPADVLADLDSKLAIVGWHWPQRDDHTPWGSPVKICHCGYDLPCSTLRLLATPFAGHPDYQEDWRL